MLYSTSSATITLIPLQLTYTKGRKVHLNNIIALENAMSYTMEPVTATVYYLISWIITAKRRLFCIILVNRAEEIDIKHHYISACLSGFNEPLQ